MLADNEMLRPPEAVDSRAFGPLPLNNILGRVMYYGRSATDHGTVDNSKAAAFVDRPILEAELDVDKLVGN